MKLTAYDLGQKKPPVATKEPMRLCPVDRKTVRLYPHRTVCVNTAIGRLIRNPERSLHDACTAPPQFRPSTYRSRLQNPAFLADLASDKTAPEIAKKWGFNHNTIKKYRTEGIQRYENNSVRPAKAQ